MEASTIEKEFKKAVDDLIKKMKEKGHTPTRLMQSIENNGTIQAVKNILAQRRPPAGFTKLKDKGKLEHTLEYLVLHPKWHDLFTHAELEEAHKRIKEAIIEIEDSAE
jgi:hypothetical protein